MNDDFMARFYADLREDAELNKSTTEMLRPQLLAALRSAGITLVTVEYNGSGDSGQLEPPQYFRDGEELENVTIPGEFASRSFNCWVGGKRQVEEKKVPFAEAIEEFFYYHLELKHGGWEINEGSEGQFDWNVTDDKIAWEHRTRIESFETDNYEL